MKNGVFFFPVIICSLTVEKGELLMGGGGGSCQFIELLCHRGIFPPLSLSLLPFPPCLPPSPPSSSPSPLLLFFPFGFAFDPDGGRFTGSAQDHGVSPSQRITQENATFD